MQQEKQAPKRGRPRVQAETPKVEAAKPKKKVLKKKKDLSKEPKLFTIKSGGGIYYKLRSHNYLEKADQE